MVPWGGDYGKWYLHAITSNDMNFRGNGNPWCKYTVRLSADIQHWWPQQLLQSLGGHVFILTESTEANWDGCVMQHKLSIMSHKSKYSGPQCIRSHPVNGACNSLSCTIRLCVIRSDRSSMLALHAHGHASNSATVRGQLATSVRANYHQIPGK